MTRTISTTLAALAFLSVSAGTLALAQSTTVGVHDNAGMFSPEAVKEADQTLRDLHRKTHWSVLIETVDSIGDKKIRDATLENARRLQEHGLYTLIAKKEHSFYTEPSNSARKAFNHDAVQEIKDAITAGFKAKDFDKGLRDAVAVIQRHAEATPDHSAATTTTPVLPGPEPAPGPASGSIPGSDVLVNHMPPAAGTSEVSMLSILLIGGGGVLLVLFLISRLFRGNRNPAPPTYNQAGMGGGNAPPLQPQPHPQPQRGYGPPPPQQPQPGYGYGPPPPQQAGGGGGFLSGMLGGAAGAVAGNILYDKFGHPHEGPGMPQHVPGGVIPTQGSNWPTPGAGPEEPSPPAETYDPNAGGGGDWGTPDANPAEADAGAGGDWGTPEPEPEPEPEPDAGAGGDWGGGGSDDSAGAGGDWGGGGSDDTGTSDDQGGSW